MLMILVLHFRAPSFKTKLILRITNMSLAQGFIYARRRLNQIGFVQSKRKTPGDGSCQIHAVMDQMRHDEELSLHDFIYTKTGHIEFRQLIVNFLEENIENNHIQWIGGEGHGSTNQWIQKMSGNAWCDEVFLTLMAILATL